MWSKYFDFSHIFMQVTSYLLVLFLMAYKR